VALRAREGGVRPARAGSTRARVDVCDTCAASAITEELTATATSRVLRKVPRRFRSSRRFLFPSRDGPPCDLLRAIYIEEGLSPCHSRSYPAGFQSPNRMAP